MPDAHEIEIAHVTLPPPAERGNGWRSVAAPYVDG
jgi:hypothetical protein